MTLPPIKCRPLVPGRAVNGTIVTTHPEQPGPYILLTSRFTVHDLPAVRNCVMVITENNAVDDHPAVICRIKGKPLVQIERATTLLGPGDVVTFDPVTALLWYGHRPLPVWARTESEEALRNALLARGPRFQVSIVDEEDVKAVNKAEDPLLPVHTVFLRGEFLWQAEGCDPFRFIIRHGLKSAIRLIEERLRAILCLLRSDQILNYRSLDLRTDETLEPGLAEANPQLGDHGVRRSLRQTEVLTAEIIAVSNLRIEGHRNLEFSIPFLVLEEELVFVMEHARRIASDSLRWGVFVETPAAVLEIRHILRYNISTIYIGTKDLTQLILACDRGNPTIGYLYDPTRRPVLEMIRLALAECDAKDMPVTLFSNIKDLDRMLMEFPTLQRISMCRAEYETLSLSQPSINRSLS
jgi:phosphoenolpyruvate synthase/pyruvate phosphate dikinase